MSVLVVGLSHRSADLALLERLAVPSDETGKALRSILELEHVLEAVVLSTCNRVEVYANVTRFHPGLQEVRTWLAERGDIHPQDLDTLQYTFHDDRAAAHLFSVAAGIDSMVVGEQQIAVQVKQAMEAARAEGAARGVLQRLFRQAVRVGRRVRRETEIGRGASSMVDVGLDAARHHLSSARSSSALLDTSARSSSTLLDTSARSSSTLLDTSARSSSTLLDTEDLGGRTVLLVGAGKMGALTADRLVGAGLERALVWNRSVDKAVRLSSRVGGEVVDGGDLAEAIADADLVVCTTGASMPVLDLELVRSAVTRRHRSGPLVLLDLAMPRNVDPACSELDGVTVLDIADIREEAHRTVTGEVVADAERIVDEEAARFLAWTLAVKVEPTIRSLRDRAEEVRVGELDRLGNKLAGLDDRQREAVEALTRGIVNTFLHDPTVRLKELADAGGAEHHAHALRELFDLDRE